MRLHQQTDRRHEGWVTRDGFIQEADFAFGFFGAAAAHGTGAIPINLGRLQIKIESNHVIRGL